MLIRDERDFRPGVKLALQVSAEPTEEELLFVQQLGVDFVTMWVNGERIADGFYRDQRKRLEQHGIQLYGMGDVTVHNQDAIVLDLPNRDAKIEKYLLHLQRLAAARIPYTTYAHMANGIWSTTRETSRGASARAFNLSAAREGTWDGVKYETPLSHGREYSVDEIWENFRYFIRKVVPVAEELGVLIGIHPDDPPVPSLAGVPRCIFSSFEGYRRALEIADSPNVGICLCVGCWLEGGKLMGKDVLETIEYFGRRGKIFKVHFRNVSAPLPHFVETFPDNGYMDMYAVMQALFKVGFDGVMIPDHIPQLGNSQMAANAYVIGYMRALLERAATEMAATS